MRKKEEKPNRKKLDDKMFAIEVCNCYLGIPETIKDCAEESRISERNDYSGITMKKVAEMKGISEVYCIVSLKPLYDGGPCK